MKQGPFAPAGLCCPGDRHYCDPLRLPLGRPPLPVAGYRRASLPAAHGGGAEEGLPSSQDDRPPVQRPLRRRVHRRPLPDQDAFRGLRRMQSGSAPSRSTSRWDSVDDACSGFARAADRTVASAPLRTRPLDHAPGLRYRGPGRLPGPDSHRLATLSLLLGYVMSISFLSWRPSIWAHSHEPGPPRSTAVNSSTI
jgi:hypothetical protein